MQGARGFRRLAAATTLLILAQLILGASMRHQHAGLAIPDFPAAYGRLWPATDDASVARYNQTRVEVVALNPITAGQIHLQMAHRFTAVLILSLALAVAVTVHRRFRWNTRLVAASRLLLGLILLQAVLGAVTIWSNKAADMATAHVAVGALCFMTSALLIFVARRTMPEGRESAGAASSPLASLPHGTEALNA